MRAVADGRQVGLVTGAPGALTGVWVGLYGSRVNLRCHEGSRWESGTAAPL